MESYYQRSINTILKNVVAIYSNIFIEDESDLISTIQMLENDPQRLFYRLFLRKATWFRVSKLDYRDIEDIPTSNLTLIDLKLCEGMSDSINDYLDLLSIEELKDYCRKRKLTVKSATRDNLIEAVISSKSSHQQTLSFGPCKKLKVSNAVSIVDSVKQFCGPIVRIVPDKLEGFSKIVDLFFVASSGNGDADNLATAILTDLNRRKYPEYQIERSGPLFNSRLQWKRYEEARYEANAVGEFLVEDEKVDVERLSYYVSDILHRWTSELKQSSYYESIRYFLRRHTPGWIYTKCLGILAELLERLRFYEKSTILYEMLLSQALFCHGKRGKWWERSALNLHKHLRRPDEALNICSEGLEDPHVRTDSRLALMRRKAKIEKDESWEEHPIEEIIIEGVLETTGSSGRKLVFRINEDTTGSVEDLVLYHFSINGDWNGMHTESSVYTSLFTILFWDIIYHPVLDVFQSPHQTCPLDFYTDNFYPEREHLIINRLSHISREGYWKDELVEGYNSHHGTVCVGVSWESYSLEDLWNVMRAVGGKALAVIFKSFAEDYKNHLSGMPDLILWRDKDGFVEHMLVEVKSARDRLSDAQRHWSYIFSNAGVKMIVCKVKHP